MKKFLLYIFLLCAYCSKAQNYQCLQAGVKHYFTNSIGYLRGIRIDSVSTTSDTTFYYPFHTPRGVYGTSSLGSPDTLDGQGGSWLGKQVVQRGDGVFVFDNFWNDTVVIRTLSAVGDTWTFCWESSALYYIATITGIDTMTVEGSLDSVKIIHITANSPSGIVTTDPANNAEILLSKNHGFVQVIDLYMFPYHAPGVSYAPEQDYYLDRSLEPMMGATSLGLVLGTIVFKLTDYFVPTYKDLYDWNIGDVYEYTINPGLEPRYPPAYAWEYILDSVTGKSILPNSLENIVSWTNYYLFPKPYGPFYGTIPQHYITNSGAGTIVYDTSSPTNKLLMPEEVGQFHSHHYFSRDAVYGCDTGNLYQIMDGHLNNEIYTPPFEAGPFIRIYKSPLGLLHSYQYIPDIENEQKLIFYNKNGRACGTFIPLGVSDENQLNDISAISIFPNPANNVLNVTCAEKIHTIAIEDMVGQMVLYNECHDKQVQVDISGLPSGMYFVKINGVATRKFVKL